MLIRLLAFLADRYLPKTVLTSPKVKSETAVLPDFSKLLDKPVPKISSSDPNPWKGLSRDLFDALEQCYSPNSHAFEKRMAALAQYRNMTKDEPTTK